jgi:hypothetical protein
MASPLSADALVKALKAEGLTVQEHAGWRTHERDDETGKTFGPVHGVLIHHTAGLGVENYVFGGSSQLPGPLCHGYIDKKGVVHMISPGRANHAGGGDPAVLKQVTDESYGTAPSKPKFGEGDSGAADGNDAFYGFECENKGDGKDPWPAVQVIAMVKASAAIVRAYKWTEKSVIGHLEWSNQKVDPKGVPMPDFRTKVKAALAVAPGKWNGTPAKPPTTTTPPPATPAPTKDQTQDARLAALEKDDKSDDATTAALKKQVDDLQTQLSQAQNTLRTHGLL